MSDAGAIREQARAHPGLAIQLPLWVSVLVVVAAILVALASAWLLITTPWGEFDRTQWWFGLASHLFTIGVGLIAWNARPGNRVGPLLILIGLGGFVSWLQHSGDPLLWTLGDMWLLLGLVVTGHLYLVFPEGRARGWSLALAVSLYVWFFAASVANRVLSEYPPAWPWQNPLLIWPNAEMATATGTIGDLGGLVLLILVVATVVRRWRRGSPVTRRAMVPVMVVSPFTLLFVGTWFLGRITGIEGLVVFSNGTVSAVFGFLFPIAFLAGLLRTSIERGSIAGLVRELDGVTTNALEPALARAVHDPSLRIAFPTGDGAGYVDGAGQAVALPQDGSGLSMTRVGSPDHTLAVLVHDASVDDELVESAAAASRLALENARLTAELRAQLEAVRASRLRIVQAADEERRRLERDLHDGAQQRLVALGFALRDATRRAHEDPELRSILEGAQVELESGLKELRTIARGLHPTALDDGLAPAIRELADRSPMPVEVKLTEVALPSSVETTAYFIAAEALTNALRHARASSIIVTGAAQDGRYRLAVSDDGRGGAEGTMDGSGMRGLRDRAQALGGTLRVESPVGGGTTVVAELPLR